LSDWLPAWLAGWMAGWLADPQASHSSWCCSSVASGAASTLYCRSPRPPTSCFMWTPAHKTSCRSAPTRTPSHPRARGSQTHTRQGWHAAVPPGAAGGREGEGGAAMAGHGRCTMSTALAPACRSWPQTTTKAQTFGRVWGHLGPASMLIVMLRHQHPPHPLWLRACGVEQPSTQARARPRMAAGLPPSRHPAPAPASAAPALRPRGPAHPAARQPAGRQEPGGALLRRPGRSGVGRGARGRGVSQAAGGVVARAAAAGVRGRSA